jgi:LuxR family maltose regulon positive regulatory protein
MSRIFGVESKVFAEYEQVLLHLKNAQAAAELIGDKATVGLIEMLQRLCVERAGLPAQALSEVTTPTQEQMHIASLNVHLFGTFQAYLNGSPINSWRKKSEAVFKYLIVHRSAPVHREKLYELFWADQNPQLARNCLNVTMHALRQSLHPYGAAIGGEPLVQFANDHFYIHPQLSVWTDTEAFMNYIAMAQLALKQGRHDEVLTYYEMAAILYRGHFLEHDRYEEWTIYHRENLKSSYIALLFQQSQLSYAQRDYAAALDYCRKMLEYDNYNEEAHCQMMRCYYAMGRRGLALRQYQVLSDMLARALGALPMRETTALFEQIKRGNLR